MSIRKFAAGGLALFVGLASSAAWAQAGEERIRRTGNFAGGAGVLTGADSSGARVCYFVEQYQPGRAYIGVSQKTAFFLTEIPEQRDDAPPKPPLRIYAGKRQTGPDGKSEKYIASKSFAGEATYSVPNRERANFNLVVTRDVEGFLSVVAAAKGDFLVIDSADGSGRDYISLLQFDASVARTLLDCQRTL